MKPLVKISIFSCLIIASSFYSLAAYATNYNVPAGTTIVSLSTYEGYAAVEYSPPRTNTLGCPGTRVDRIAIIDWKSNANNKSLYNAALAAYLLGNTVGMGINNISLSNTDIGNCHVFDGGSPRIYRIDMK